MDPYELTTQSESPRPPTRFGARALVIAAVAVVAASAIAFALTRGHGNANVAPYVNTGDPNDRHVSQSHWHAALGMYDCDHWMGDRSGDGVWKWPTVATINGQPVPGRAGTNTYAGLHSHDDGIIHMEPATADDAGNNATVGRYFDEGGWTVGPDGFTFLGITRHNGDRCGDTNGSLQWWINGTQHNGDPAGYKLYQGDVVVIAFEPANAPYPGDPPSAANLGRATGLTAPTRPASRVPGKPCVAPKGPMPSGAPAVPVPVGPPPTELVIKDVKVGTGPVVKPNAKVVVDYVLVACSTGRVVDSSYSSNEPFDADLSGGLIDGWIRGIPGMRIGGRRLLGVPPSEGYGVTGSGPIGPNETLWFLIDAMRLG